MVVKICACLFYAIECKCKSKPAKAAFIRMTFADGLCTYVYRTFKTKIKFKFARFMDLVSRKKSPKGEIYTEAVSP